MNSRANKPCLERLRRLWTFCCFGMTPALTSKAAVQYLNNDGGVRFTIEQLEPSRPYLAAVGPPPLRFADPAPVASPSAQSPAKPAGAQASSAKPAEATPPQPPSQPPPAGPKQAPSPSIEAHSAGQPLSPEPVQPSIIPDEMRPRVRPEEFLPFFQLPGTGVPGASQPSPLPPTTATYKQE